MFRVRERQEQASLSYFVNRLTVCSPLWGKKEKEDSLSHDNYDGRETVARMQIGDGSEPTARASEHPGMRLGVGGRKNDVDGVYEIVSCSILSILYALVQKKKIIKLAVFCFM